MFSYLIYIISEIILLHNNQFSDISLIWKQFLLLRFILRKVKKVQLF